MLSIVVLNKANGLEGLSEQALNVLGDKALIFKTCLRELIILDEMDFLSLKAKGLDLKSYKVYKSYSGLNYIIKVLSGLESPVLGETEVLGQFKSQILEQLDLKPKFKEVVQFIMSMVKLVRSKHLIGLGSKTYGSLVRRLVKNDRHILFVGAGILAESIFPWVKDQKQVMFSVRCPSKYKNKDKFKGFHFNKTSESLDFDFDLSLVVCAPISSEKLLNHIANARVKTIVDLREESEKDPIVLESANVIDLKDAFAEMSQHKKIKDKIVQAVETDLNKNIESKFVKHRPFGWDDLCM